MRKSAINNPRYPHTIKIVRKGLPEDEFDETVTEEVLYEGKGRGYTDTTTTGEGKVDENKRKVSIPVRFDEWDKAVLDGDTIEVTKGNVKETGLVKDFEPDNNRTVVYWELKRS